jgi:hypothetical protein
MQNEKSRGLQDSTAILVKPLYELLCLVILNGGAKGVGNGATLQREMLQIRSVWI